MTRSLVGRNAIITGGNQGLGLAIAAAYVDAGANVMLCARDVALLDVAARDLATRTGEGQRVLARRCDVSNADDVGALVDAALGAFGRVHVLVNNAGVYGPMGRVEDNDWLEWTRALEINLYGSILPCRALIPHFRVHGYGKIVQISGGGATNPLPRLSAYAASKAAVVRFAESLALELEGTGIDVNSIAPGALKTRMMDQLLAAGPSAVGDAFFARMQRIADEGGAPLERGAALAVFLGSAASDGLTGRLLAALWDPWERLGAVKDALGDVYTLRRIVPEDRGKNWSQL